ncbi:MAG: hypothetical protein KC442_01335, partial [Thermomicrobiales bacterium]|nr:hypothetical protein [Thermomicrobiales bacterium]
EQALALARKHLATDLPHLAAVTPQQLAALEAGAALSPTLARRVRHVVEETARVAEGRRALADADWAQFGRLMTASGRSSATLYDISHPEVEALVSTANALPGVLGARMMGGGEGGAVLVLVHRDAVASFAGGLRAGFYAERGRADEPGLIHVCAFAPGATLVGRARPV